MLWKKYILCVIVTNILMNVYTCMRACMPVCVFCVSTRGIWSRCWNQTAERKIDFISVVRRDWWTRLRLETMKDLSACSCSCSQNQSHSGVHVEDIKQPGIPKAREERNALAKALRVRNASKHHFNAWVKKKGTAQINGNTGSGSKAHDSKIQIPPPSPMQF